MDRLEDVFDNAISDLQTINWSETDGSDVEKILKDAFSKCLKHKSEIINMSEIINLFDETSELNKFQKMMIKDILLKM